MVKLKTKTASVKAISHLLLFRVKKTNCTKLTQDCQSQTLNHQSYALTLPPAHLPNGQRFTFWPLAFISFPFWWYNIFSRARTQNIVLKREMKSAFILKWKSHGNSQRASSKSSLWCSGSIDGEYLRATYFRWMASEWHQEEGFGSRWIPQLVPHNRSQRAHHSAGLINSKILHRENLFSPFPKVVYSKEHWFETRHPESHTSLLSVWGKFHSTFL